MASGRSDNGGVARDVGGMGTGVVVSDVWSRERTARLLAAGGAATVTVVLFLNLRSGAEELWRIPGSTPTELNSRRWDLPDDPDRYIGLDLMFVVAFTATLLLAVSLAFVFREWRAASLSEGWWHLANIRGAGRRKMGMVATTSWWRDPLVAGAIAAGAVLCYALGDVFETLLLGDIVDQQTPSTR